MESSWQKLSGGAGAIQRLEDQAEKFRTDFGGGTLAVRRWTPSDSNCALREPVVLLHGGSGSWKHWLKSIPALLQQRPVVAVDTPGYGDSDMPVETVTFPLLGRLIATGLKPVVARGAHFAGFSLGSFIAPHAALALGAPVRSMTLIHGHFWGPMNYTPRNSLKRWRNVTDLNEQREILRFNLGQLMLAHPQSADDLTLDVYTGDLGKARLRVETFIQGLDTTILQRLTAPLMAVSGALDPTGIPSVSDQMHLLKAAIPATQCHILENCGHWAMWESPEKINELMLEFLLKADETGSY